MTTPGATGFGYTGIALETTPGTAVASEDFIPVTSGDGEEATDVLPDQGMRGSMATLYGAVGGKKSASYNIEGDVFLDTIGWQLAGILGECAVTDTSGSAPYTHVFTLNNDRTTTKGQCPSYTIHDYQGVQARKYAGAKMSSFTLRCSAQELLTYSASYTTLASATETAETPSFGTTTPLPGWNGTINFAGSGTANKLIEEAEITFSRNVSVVQTVDGSQNPIQIWQGPLSVSGRFMFVANDETEFLKYLSVNNDATPDGQVSVQMAFTQGTHSLTVLMTQIVYNSSKVERGSDYTEVSAQFDAIANTTDKGVSGGYGPCKVTLVNGVAGDLYIAAPE